MITLEPIMYLLYGLIIYLLTFGVVTPMTEVTARSCLRFVNYYTFS
jgi:type II secretory pathway component PulF